VRRSVYCTASFSVCSRRRTELPIIYPDLWLDYKVATHPIALGVLKRAMNELNERADLTFRYEPIKEGRRLVGWSFRAITQDFPQNSEYKKIFTETKAALMEIGRKSEDKGGDRFNSSRHRPRFGKAKPSRPKSKLRRKNKSSLYLHFKSPIRT
jgi:hypothetical protein